MKPYLLAAVAALALAPAHASVMNYADYLCGAINGKHLCAGDAGSVASDDPNEDPLLGPTAQGQLKHPVDPVALAIAKQFRECVAEEPWRKGLPRTGVVLTDDCYREARGLH